MTTTQAPLHSDRAEDYLVVRLKISSPQKIRCLLASSWAASLLILEEIGERDAELYPQEEVPRDWTETSWVEVGRD